MQPFFYTLCNYRMVSAVTQPTSACWKNTLGPVVLKISMGELFLFSFLLSRKRPHVGPPNLYLIWLPVSLNKIY